MSIADPSIMENIWRSAAATFRARGDGYQSLAAMAQACLPPHLADDTALAEDQVPPGWCELQRWAAVLGIEGHQPAAAAAAAAQVKWAANVAAYTKPGWSAFEAAWSAYQPHAAEHDVTPCRAAFVFAWDAAAAAGAQPRSEAYAAAKGVRP